MPALLVAAGLLLCCCGACTPQQHTGSGNFHDMEAFKAYRMRLPEKHEPLCLVAVGDIMLSRYVDKKIKEHGDPGYPFAGVKQFLQSGDITFGNLEGPVTPGREIEIPEMVLRADPEVAPALKEAGFDILSLANNHVPDFGAQGILDTMRYLDSAAIFHAGAGKNGQQAYTPRYMEVKGVKLAFLAFNDPAVVPEAYIAGDGPGTAVLNTEKVTAAVKEAAANADFTVVYLHAGTEYTAEPDATQIRFARLAIDSGADLVLGSHPHVVQKVERYRGKYILYSLGNFVFDQLWSRETREGVIARIWISKKGVEKIEFLPVYINDDAKPVPLGGPRGQKVAEKLRMKLAGQTIPVWNNENNVFTAIEKYVVSPAGGEPAEYRLVQREKFDMDSDGTCEEFYLKNGIITVRDASRTIWQSAANWWVDYFFLGDVNNDGITELNLLVWKKGSFGPQKPFWLQKEDTSIKNHLFVFKLENDGIKPVWQSSNLDRPNYRAAASDLDGDGANELLVTEGSYTDPARREITLWQWNGWGFTRISLQE